MRGYGQSDDCTSRPAKVAGKVNAMKRKERETFKAELRKCAHVNGVVLDVYNRHMGEGFKSGDRVRVTVELLSRKGRRGMKP